MPLNASVKGMELDMPIQKSNLFLMCILLLGLPECTTSTNIPTTTSLSTFTPEPTPTDIQLPYNLVTESSEYCKMPYGYLPVDERSLTQDEIVYKLVEIWLERYVNPDAHPYCRIDGYTIDGIHDDPTFFSQHLIPKSDLMRVIVFSIKLIQVPNDWMSFQSSELDQQNWLHISQTVAVVKTNKGYKLEFSSP